MSVIISDDVGNTFTFDCKLDDDVVIDQSEAVTNNGSVMTQIVGRRYVATLTNCRVDKKTYGSFISMLSNGTSHFLLNLVGNDLTNAPIASTYFPMAISLTTPSKKLDAWDGKVMRRFDVSIKSISYL
jgi:hypothetical protein